MKYTQKNLQVGERRILASRVSNMANWREATEADIAEVECQKLDPLKEAKIAELLKYDKSEAVNEFYYGEIADWVDLDTRNSIRNNSIPSQENEKRTEMYVSLGKVAGVFPIVDLKAMLQRLEDYAYLCWVVTDKHKRSIQALTTAEEIEAYDFTIGYPKKVRFEAL